MKMGAYVLAYHGCDRDVAEQLLAGTSPFRSSENDHDWLGHGIYFWENNPKRALEWARFMASHPRFKKRVQKPYAVGAVIDLGNCLDLTEAISLRIVKEAYSQLKQVFDLSGLPLPSNKPVSDSDVDILQRNLDCAVINHVHHLNKAQGVQPFDTVRGAFHEGDSLYPGSGIRQKTHLQLSVRNQDCIGGIFRIRDIDKL